MRKCSVKNVYTKVTQIAREQLYQFMKDNQVSPLNYHFHYYFDDCIQKFGIKVMEHHFTNRKIEGLTMIDEDGISISYESQNPQVKQNFTKCHELGHYILGHSGKQFTQLSSKKDMKYHPIHSLEKGGFQIQILFQMEEELLNIHFGFLKNFYKKC